MRIGIVLERLTYSLLACFILFFLTYVICPFKLHALRFGFNEVVPHHFMDMFDEREAELIICGLGEINVKDWAENSEYRLCESSTPVVRMTLAEKLEKDNDGEAWKKLKKIKVLEKRWGGIESQGLDEGAGRVVTALTDVEESDCT